MNPVSLFGDRLKEERERLGLSQAAAGAAAGVSREMWGKYERGAMPGGEVILSLAGTGFDMNYLFTGQRGAAPAPVLSREEAALLDNFRHCPPEGRACIKATSDAFAKSKGKVKKAV